jgi:hypothetical protein
MRWRLNLRDECNWIWRSSFKRPIATGGAFLEVEAKDPSTFLCTLDGVFASAWPAHYMG